MALYFERIPNFIQTDFKGFVVFTLRLLEKAQRVKTILGPL